MGDCQDGCVPLCQIRACRCNHAWAGQTVGETILVTMVIGNVIGPSAIPTTLFSQGQTLSSLIANEFNEASSELHLSALIALGAILYGLDNGNKHCGSFPSKKKIKASSGAKSQ